MSVTADPHLRRGAGSVLVALGTAGAIFALAAPGGSSADGARTIELGSGLRALELDLARADVRMSAATGDQATVRVTGDARIEHAVESGTARVRCGDGADCAGVRLDVRVPRAVGVRARVGAGSMKVTGLGDSIDLQGTSATLTVFDATPRTLRVRTTSGAIHVSLARVATLVDVRSTTGAIAVSVPYAYRTDGYAVRTRTRGHLDRDITAVRRRDAPAVRAMSQTGDLLITQRYPNMS